MAKLLIFGCGYSGRAIARSWHGEVIGTTRSHFDRLSKLSIEPVSLEAVETLSHHIKTADAIVISTPPPDPVIDVFGAMIAASNAWVGYLSSTAVYGDRAGAEVDETTPPAPSSRRGEMRLATELAWQEIVPSINLFRLAGIYGPFTGPLAKVRSVKARKIVKQGQQFGRIHVDDISRVIHASINASDQGEIYNLTDSLTAPPQDVLDYSCELLGLAPLPAIPFETAKLSAMARSFYGENKVVSNEKILNRFGKMLYPDYKTGLMACLKAENACP